MAELAPGTVFAGHRIEALAGRGGMGVVYRATHLALDRSVALKVIAPTLTEDGPTRQRFLRESKIAASIDHPNVIPIYYTGEEDGIAYIAMRYVAGEDLRSLVRAEGGLDPGRAARIVAQVAAGLDAAHAASLVHRDVKPANVLLGPGGHVYLSDFGLSKHALSIDGETRSGQWVGTLDYVAPEQIRGERPDARADVYALGCVLYFALTGCPPYDHEGDEAKLWAHLSETPPAPSDRVPGLPPDLDGVVARALAKRPADRYPSAGDLGRAAVAAAEHETVRERERVVGVGAAAPDETPTETGGGPVAMPARSEAATVIEPAAKRRRPSRVVVATGVVGLAAIAAAAVALGTGGDGGNPGTTPTPTPTPTSSAIAKASHVPVAPKVTARVTVGRRPNSVAVGKGMVFVTNFRNKRVTLIDEKAAKLRRPRPTVGVGGVAATAGLGAVWVAVTREHALVKLDPATGKLLARIALPLAPTAVTVGPKGVWVGMLTATPGTPDVLAKVDPGTRTVVATRPVPEGIVDLVETPTAIWIVHRLSATLGRFDLASQAFVRRVVVGENRLGSATYGAGAVWVVSPQEDTVTRIDDRTGKKVASGVGRRPTGIAAHGSQIWVTSFIDHTITRIDPRTSRPIGHAVPVPLNPYALAITRDSVWVTAVGRGEVARVRIAAPR